MLSDRDRARLTGVHPTLVAAVERVLAAMAAFGTPMFVVMGLRTDAEQQALYAQGRTVAGGIVTYADGVIKKSMHQAQADGYGHAVDCAFLDNPATRTDETWDLAQPWVVYGTAGHYLGLTWGGSWQRLTDRPHLELPLDGATATAPPTTVSA